MRHVKVHSPDTIPVAGLKRLLNNAKKFASAKQFALTIAADARVRYSDSENT